MTGRVALVLVLALLLPAFAAAQVQLEVSRWLPDMDGDAQIVERGIGTTIDFRDDLGMADEDLTSFRLSWRGRRSFAALGYEQVDYAGDRVVTRSIAFSGQLYTFGTRVVSDLEIRRGVLQLGWQPLGDPNGRFRFGPMVELIGFSFEGRLSGPELSPPVTEQDDLQAAAPALGLALDVQVARWLRLAARGALIQVGGTGSYRSAEAGALIGPFGHVGVSAGWRMFRFEYEDEPDQADIELSGPFAGLLVRF